MPANILVLSFHDEASLDLQVTQLIGDLSSVNSSSVSLNDFCASHNSLQSLKLSRRVAVIGSSVEEFITAFKSRSFISPRRPRVPKSRLCFQFTGQGSQYYGMGDGLYASCSTYRHHFEACAKFLCCKYGLDLARLPKTSLSSSSFLKHAAALIPAFVVQTSLVQTWKSWGICPDFVVSHSLGEYAAAAACGIFSVEAGLQFLVDQCRFLRILLPNARMLVIRQEQEKVRKLIKNLKGRLKNKNEELLLEFAVINSPAQVVMGGNKMSIKKLADFCARKNFKCQELPSTHAYHTRLMYPIHPFCKRVADRMPFEKEPQIPFISGITGELVGVGEVDATYWGRHIVSKVNFLKAAETALNLGCDFFVEIGPRPVLNNLVKEINDWRNEQTTVKQKVTCFPSLKPGEDDWNTIIKSLGQLYVSGWDVNWEAFHRSVICPSEVPLEVK